MEPPVVSPLCAGGAQGCCWQLLAGEARPWAGWWLCTWLAGCGVRTEMISTLLGPEMRPRFAGGALGGVPIGRHGSSPLQLAWIPWLSSPPAEVGTSSTHMAKSSTGTLNSSSGWTDGQSYSVSMFCIIESAIDFISLMLSSSSAMFVSFRISCCIFSTNFPAWGQNLLVLPTDLTTRLMSSAYL